MSWAPVGGNATWEYTFGSIGMTGCTYWTISQGALNQFYLTVGSNNGTSGQYDHQYNTSYP